MNHLSVRLVLKCAFSLNFCGDTEEAWGHGSMGAWGTAEEDRCLYLTC